MNVTSVWRQKPSDFYDFWCMKSWGNLTAEYYKFAHLTCILWPHYLESKKSFSTMLFICASECSCYYWTKWITTVTMQLSGRSLVTSYRKCSKWRPSAWTQLQSLLRHCSIASPTMLRWNSVCVSTSRCRNSTTIHIPGYTLMHQAQDAVIHNLGRDRRMVTCF